VAFDSELPGDSSSLRAAQELCPQSSLKPGQIVSPALHGETTDTRRVALAVSAEPSDLRMTATKLIENCVSTGELVVSMPHAVRGFAGKSCPGQPKGMQVAGGQTRSEAFTALLSESTTIAPASTQKWMDWHLARESAPYDCRCMLLTEKVIAIASSVCPMDNAMCGQVRDFGASTIVQNSESFLKTLLLNEKMLCIDQVAPGSQGRASLATTASVHAEYCHPRGTRAVPRLSCPADESNLTW
jgi:hypothetical protein